MSLREQAKQATSTRSDPSPEENTQQDQTDSTAPAALPADESRRFMSQTEQPPEGFPEKFLRDGKPDFGELIKSYNELGGHLQQKEEDIRTRIEEERLKNRPESPDQYTPPKLEGVDEQGMAEITESPAYKWWQQEAHKNGLDQETFEAGIAEYVKQIQPPPVDLEAVKKELGDNANARIDAVINWMDTTFKDQPELAQKLDSMLTDATSIKLVEFMMRGGKPLTSADTLQQSEPEITEEKLREMQKDPRYWDASRRDMAFVKKVEDGYAKLFPTRR